ncbi:MAG: hypothetical protein A2W34_03025 [Chloroflexi bacterium RBG_16_64_32]|nr:MAG: hypothetical protein A2W34_03025 [Chloroflexi bacterium RBG_16_64_32]
MDEPRFEPLFDMKVELEPPQMIGQTPQGNRQIFYVRSGTFEGPRMKGEVLPGGGDWFLLRPDNVGELDVRGTLKTHDDALIYATYRGIFSASQEAWEKIYRGDPVDRDQYYFYTAPMFQTSAPAYLWLNRILAVGIGSPVPGGVSYQVFALA